MLSLVRVEDKIMQYNFALTKIRSARQTLIQSYYKEDPITTWVWGIIFSVGFSKKKHLKFRLITLVLLLFFCLIWFLHDDIGARKESVIRIAPDEDKSTKNSTPAFSSPDFDRHFQHKLCNRFAGKHRQWVITHEFDTNLDLGKIVGSFKSARFYCSSSTTHFDRQLFFLHVMKCREV